LDHICTDRVWDAACWVAKTDSGGDSRLVVLSNAAHPGLEITMDRAAPGEPLMLPEGATVGEAGGVFALTLQRGPAERPLASLAHLTEHGYAILPSLYPPRAVAEMKRSFDEMQQAPAMAEAVLGERVSLENIINHTPTAAKCAVHPVVMALLVRSQDIWRCL